MKCVTTTTTTATVLRPPWLCLGLLRWAVPEGKTNLDLVEQEIVSGNGISWAICKSASHPIMITMPASHHSVFYRPDAHFYGPDALPAAQPTTSKHWWSKHWKRKHWRRLDDMCYSVFWRCWLGGRKGIWPVKKLEWWDAGMVMTYVSGSWCRFAYGSADATATHYLLLQ